MATLSLDQLRLACLNRPAQPSPEWLREAGRQVMDAMVEDFANVSAGAARSTQHLIRIR